MNPLASLGLILGLLTPSDRPASEVAIDQLTVIQYMLSETPAEATHVFWTPCGTANAAYYTPFGPIELCLELNETPAPVFAAAHEAGHALVWQLGMDVDPDAEAGERAADELAALFLIEMGRPDDVVGGARWFMSSPDRKSDGVHPQHRLRAWELLCLVDGSEPTGTAECQVLYHAVYARWALALALALN